MKVFHFARFFCLTLVAVFLSFILAGNNAFASTVFPDVSDNHWAARHISKVNAMGIVGGYEDGTFRPDQAVTQLEAVLMSLRAMGETPGSNTAVPFAVPSWAERDVAKALDQGLINGDEAFNASSGATRAWTTRVLVRLVGLDGEAQGEQALPSFVDSYQIPAWAVGYVRVAQNNNLVGGYTDNTFRPDRAVTRAELAALLGRALERLGEFPGSATGRVMEKGDGYLTVTLLTGEKNTYLVPFNASLYSEDSRITLDQLSLYDRVMLVADGDTIKYLEKLPGEPVSNVLHGILQRVYAEMGSIVLELEGGELRTLALPEGSDVSVIGSSRQGLNALEPGDRLEVSLNSRGYIIGIIVSSRSQGALTEGVVYDIDSERMLITFQGDNGKLQSYRLAEHVVVNAYGHRFPTIENVGIGDRIRVVVDNGIVRELEVLQATFRVGVNGKVLSVSPVGRIITIEDNNQLKAFRVAGNASIKVSGLDGAGLTDIVVGDEVQARVEGGEIVALEVLGRQVDGKLKGTVMGVDSSNRVVTLRDSQNVLRAYEVRSNARVIVGGEEVKLGDIKKDMRVSIRLVDNEVALIEMDSSIAGTIVDLDNDGLLLVLRDTSGNRETYIIDKDVRVRSYDDRNRLSDVRNGDYVEIALGNKHTVEEIKLRSELVLRVDSVRESSERIDTRDTDGSTRRLYLNDGAELIVPGISRPRVGDVKEGDVVRAFYIGSDLEKVEVLPSARGRVTSVNSYARTFTVEFYDGKSSILSFTNNCRVVVDGKSYESLSMLSTGDRVEVLDNTRGGRTIYVMKGISGKLAFEVDNDNVYLEDSVKGWERYDLYKDAGIYDSRGSISRRDLRKGNRVTIYVLNDLVYEIRRQ